MVTLTVEEAPKTSHVHVVLDEDGDVAIMVNEYVLGWLTTDGEIIRRHCYDEEKTELVALGFKFDGNEIVVA